MITNGEEIHGELRKRGRYWHYRCYLGPGVKYERSTGEVDRRRAVKKAAELYAIAKLLKDDPEAEILFSRAMIREVDRISKDVSKAQGERASCCLGNFLEWLGKDLSLESISARTLEDYQRARLQEAAKDTVNKELCFILKMLRINGYVIARPSPKAGKVTKQRGFSKDELIKFFAHCPDKLKTLFLTMLATGARPAELIPSNRSQHVALLKSEVDLEGQRITIRSAKLAEGRNEGVRVIAIPEDLAAMLKEQSRRTPGLHLFSHIDNLAHHFDNILEDADIGKLDALGAKLTAHSFRHTFATLAAESVGCNPFILQKILGHTQISTTARYCHAQGVAAAIDLTSLLSAPVSNTLKDAEMKAA